MMQLNEIDLSGRTISDTAIKTIFEIDAMEENSINDSDIVIENITNMNSTYYNSTNRNNILVDSAEVSFPNAEELRTSYTSRVSNTSTKKEHHDDTAAESDTKMNKMRRYVACLSRRYCVGTTMIVMMITIFVLMGLLIAQVQKNHDSTGGMISDKSFIDIRSPQDRPRPSMEDVMKYIVTTGVSSKESFLDTDSNTKSAQYEAVRWLTQSDPLNLPIPVFDLSSYDSYMYIVRYIMIVNYFALNGPYWEYDVLYFLSNQHVCDWNNYIVDSSFDAYNLGLFCEISSENDTDLFGQLQRVPTLLHLAGKMDGRIPTENGMLTTLISFSMNNNPDLFGTIPTELCQLTNLQVLRLYKNQLTGAIPDCMNQLPSLELLDVSYNLLSGKVPESLCNLPMLDELFLQSNWLSGSIPSCVGSKLTSLVQLQLSLNVFEGTIPNELCQLTELLLLDLSKNVLDGTIPACIGASFPLLEVLDVSQNALYGTIPNEFAQLKNTMEVLVLHHNRLTGDPSSIFNQLHRLRMLLINANYFLMTLDETFLRQSLALERLDVSQNRIDGLFPKYLIDTSLYPNLLSLDIGSNNITGTLDGIQMNNVLEMLSMDGNDLYGPIISLTNLSQLEHLDISANSFTGSIEPVSQLRQLRNLFLGENQFQSGSIPQSFGLLKDLESLSLRDSGRTGNLFDPNIDQWESINYIDFGSNNLEGTIPITYGRLSNLFYLLLNDNPGIVGTVPSEFTNLLQLRGVLLDGTSITASDSLDVLCSLPYFQTNSSAYEFLVVNCIGQCHDHLTNDQQCAICQCCDPSTLSNTSTSCSNSVLPVHDVFLEDLFRLSSGFYTTVERITPQIDESRNF